MFLEHCRHIECVCVSFCLSRRERMGTDAPPATVLTGQSSSPPAGHRKCISPAQTVSWKTSIHQLWHPSQACGCPFPRQCLGRLQVCLCLRARTSPHILCHWSGPAQLGFADPICGLLEQKWGIKVCVVHLPVLNMMEVFKTRDLLESSPSQ